jgi:signal transduction histidine kinase
MTSADFLLIQSAFNALNASIAVLDANGTIICVNEAWRRSADEGGIDDAPPVPSQTNYLAVCERAVQQGEVSAAQALSGIREVLASERDTFTLEYCCDTPAGERWYQMVVSRCEVPSAVGGPARHGAVIRHDDISAEKQQCRTLDTAQRLLRAVIDAMPVGVWIMDEQGRIVYGNAAGIRIWAGAKYVGPEQFGEYKGRWLTSGEPIAPEQWAAARAIRRGETSMDEEVEIECFDGTRKIILNSAAPLLDNNGRIVGAVIVNQDITTQKQAEVDREARFREEADLLLAAVEDSRSKDAFIATLAHEVRTPLQAVLGWASMINLGRIDPSAVPKATATIERSARSIVSLLDETLELSRIARGTLNLRYTVVDVRELVEDVLEMMRPAAAARGVELGDQLDPVGAVRGDSERLRQVVWNLLSNALKFTPRQGRVRVQLTERGAALVLSVQDSGCGIPAAFLPRVFEAFQQGTGASGSPKAGLGLGLAIVKELVELHGGSVVAESRGEGQGATFTVSLPVFSSGAPSPTS